MEIITLFNDWGVPYVLMGLIGWGYLRERNARTANLEQQVRDARADTVRMESVIHSNNVALQLLTAEVRELREIQARQQQRPRS